MSKSYLFLFGLLTILWLAACEPGSVPPQLNGTEVAILAPTLTAVALGTPHPLLTLIPSDTPTLPTPQSNQISPVTTPTQTKTLTPSPTNTRPPAETPTPLPSSTPGPSPTSTASPTPALPTPAPSATSVASTSEQSWLDYANSYRALAGVPPAEAEAALSANCEQHARYMVQNN